MLLFRAGVQPALLPVSTPAPAARPRQARTVGEVDVLLLDAQDRQSLAAMRVYARAGLTVGAVACESEAWWAPSLKSKVCALRAIVPDLGGDANAYVNALLHLLDEHPARMLMPAGDGTIHALRFRRAEFERRTALPLASETALDIAVSKSKTLALAADLGIAVPHTIQLSDSSDVRVALREVGLPAVIKPVESWVERGGRGTRLSPNVVLTEDEANRTVEHVFSEGGRAIVQPWLPGRREAVTLFYTQGRFWARLAQASYREWPVLGGASVLCATIPLLADIAADSERLVRAIDLEGCSMVEFRRNRDGRPVLMEVNPRMGGSVALAISAGINFPKLMYDWKLDRPLEEQVTYQVGKRLRWLAGDIWNLKCSFENQGHPDVRPRLAAAATFVADFLRPTDVDGLELGDIRPALAEMNRIVFRHSVRRARSLFFARAFKDVREVI